jgi:nitronate monooxygenase
MSEKISPSFLNHAGVRLPIIGGAMYPCSNPELVAAVSEAGGIGIVQPISLVFVHKYDFRAGLRHIRSLTSKPIGVNIIVEKSSQIYLDRMAKWVDIAIEEGVKFFVTALGNPDWVVQKAKAVGGYVYHDVTDRKWALKAMEAGVDGFICVNNKAGGHAGTKSPAALFEELSDLGLPLICAGGIGSEIEYLEAIRLGYQGVQLGTRMIATQECNVHVDYKNAILKARASDIVLTEKISGVPVAIIRTPYVDKIGTQAGPVAKWLLKHPKYKHYMRMVYTLQATFKLQKASKEGSTYNDYFQAGKSVEGIDKIEPVAAILQRFAKAVDAPKAT